jgi:hypothetical protein
MNKKIRGLEKETQIKKCKLEYKKGGKVTAAKPSMQRRCK